MAGVQQAVTPVVHAQLYIQSSLCYDVTQDLEQLQFEGWNISWNSPVYMGEIAWGVDEYLITGVIAGFYFPPYPDPPVINTPAPFQVYCYVTWF